MNQLSLEFIQGLKNIFPEGGLSLKPEEFPAFWLDRSTLKPQAPLAIAWAERAGQVAALLKLCNEARVPVTARGAGTSLEGNSIPSEGGIVLSLERMNQVLEIMPQDFEVRLQPGVVYDELNRQLAPHRLFFAPGPSSGDTATVGGMIGNNAGGLNALRYGVTRNHVIRLQVALADGSLLWYGTQALKTSAGFDLVQLMVGSEGMLGIVTEIVLRLQALPQRRTALAQFKTVEAAAQAVFEIMSTGIVPGALELIDASCIHYVNIYKGWEWEETPTLLMEFHGAPAGTDSEVSTARRACESLGATKFLLAENEAMAEQLWAGRKEITNAEKALYPNHAILNGDIAVPLSKYAATIHFAKEAGEAKGMPMTLFGHAGDGNIHCHVLVPPNVPGAQAKGEEVYSQIIRYALAAGGTVSAEHGIGLAKKEFLVEEHGEAVEVMRKIKRALDPNNILNPDKMFH
jgi:D-lactate dehydrogenase (cytochrome)